MSYNTRTGSGSPGTLPRGPLPADQCVPYSPVTLSVIVDKTAEIDFVSGDRCKWQHNQISITSIIHVTSVQFVLLCNKVYYQRGDILLRLHLRFTLKYIIMQKTRCSER